MGACKIDPDRLGVIAAWITVLGDFLAAVASQAALNQEGSNQDNQNNGQYNKDLCLIENYICKLEKEIACLQRQVKNLEKQHE